MNVSNQTKKAKKLMMYGWMMAFLILGSSGESLGSGTDTSMDLGEEKIGERQKAKIIAEKNEEEKKHDNEEEKKEEAKKEGVGEPRPQFKRRSEDPVIKAKKEALNQQIDDLKKQLQDKKTSGKLKSSIEKLSFEFGKKPLSEMDRSMFEKELEEKKEELVDLKKQFKDNEDLKENKDINMYWNLHFAIEKLGYAIANLSDKLREKPLSEGDRIIFEKDLAEKTKELEEIGEINRCIIENEYLLRNRPLVEVNKEGLEG